MGCLPASHMLATYMTMSKPPIHESQTCGHTNIPLATTTYGWQTGLLGSTGLRQQLLVMGVKLASADTGKNAVLA